MGPIGDLGDGPYKDDLAQVADVGHHECYMLKLNRYSSRIIKENDMQRFVRSTATQTRGLWRGILHHANCFAIGRTPRFGPARPTQPGSPWSSPEQIPTLLTLVQPNPE